MTSGTSATAGPITGLIVFNSSSSDAKSAGTSNHWIGEAETIKDGKGGFDTAAMTFTTASGTVDRQSSDTFGQPFGSIRFTFDAAKWRISP